MPSEKVTFKNQLGYELSAKIDYPLSQGPHPFAIFVHVFTGNKNLKSARHISRALTLNGVAVLRFDFTGLGESEGDFADTNFTSNIEDIIAANDYLEEHHTAPCIIIGHSLGGAASLFAGAKLDNIKAIVTIGAPSYPEHVTHLLKGDLSKIENEGHATINIDGRQFVIKKQFLDDLKNQDHVAIIKNLNKALLVMHSPQDNIVEIGNAANIYHLAHHPKSFVTLDGADHMLTAKDDAFYAGHELLNSALGACTAMTLQMYARRKGWDLQDVTVHLSHSKETAYFQDAQDSGNAKSKIDRFERIIELEGDLDDEQRQRLLQIADRCPIHRTLESPQEFVTRLK